jgi:hypothetical protein
VFTILIRLNTLFEKLSTIEWEVEASYFFYLKDLQSEDEKLLSFLLYSFVIIDEK